MLEKVYYNLESTLRQPFVAGIFVDTYIFIVIVCENIKPIDDFNAPETGMEIDCLLCKLGNEFSGRMN